MKVLTTKDIFQKSSIYILTLAQWVHSEKKNSEGLLRVSSSILVVNMSASCHFVSNGSIVVVSEVLKK